MTERDSALARLRVALPELRRQWPIRSLALFGSVVRGDATSDSDLDVLVEFDRPIDVFAFIALEERLSELTGRRVDLVSRRSLKRHVGESILAEAVPI